MTDQHELDSVVDELSTLLLDRRWRMCSVESCTGGWVAQVLTDLAGSSSWFECGWVTYSNEAKMRDVGVSPATLEQFGAVSEAVAEEMARGGIAVSAANAALSITGVAGPTGGSVEKPVGTVCFGWAIEREVISETVHFKGDRRLVRQQSMLHALRQLINHVKAVG